MNKKDRKKLVARENFLIKYGRFPTDDELESMLDRKRPRISFGFNTSPK